MSLGNRDIADIYEEVSEIVESETGINIRDTGPQIYVPAILKALKSLKENSCSCKEGRGCI